MLPVSLSWSHQGWFLVAFNVQQDCQSHTYLHNTLLKIITNYEKKSQIWKIYIVCYSPQHITPCRHPPYRGSRKTLGLLFIPQGKRARSDLFPASCMDPLWISTKMLCKATLHQLAGWQTCPPLLLPTHWTMILKV